VQAVRLLFIHPSGVRIAHLWRITSKSAENKGKRVNIAKMAIVPTHSKFLNDCRGRPLKLERSCPLKSNAIATQGARKEEFAH